MALVAYSDSEGSDTETPSAPAPVTTAKVPSKPAFQKIIDRSEPRKIKVDLPAVRPEPGAEGNDRPAKKARTAGAFSGFNSLLPAPKRAAQSGPKPGVSLKTSGQAAFSREPVEQLEREIDAGNEDLDMPETAVIPEAQTTESEEAKEVKPAGKATRFRPLSVANKKKPKKPKVMPDPLQKVNDTVAAQEHSTAEAQVQTAPKPKPKVSLFSVPQEEDDASKDTTTDAYEPLIASEQPPREEENTLFEQTAYQPTPSQPPANSLDAVASDLNLTPAQRRQLFGRHAKNGDMSDVKLTHFNTSAEYAANEQLRQAGEVVEHRAVKTIAPGKHSLQQLVNSAATQKDALEDHWAAGKRNRSEGGSKYGWGK